MGHPVATFVWSLLNCFDRNRFEVTAYIVGKKYDSSTDELLREVNCKRDLRAFSPAKAAEVVHADGIQILFDLSGHSSYSALQILAYKPAPIQITGIGHISTSGLKEIDYFLADEFTSPAGMNEQDFTEKIIRNHRSHICFSQPMLKNMPQCQMELPYRRNGYITFAIVNKPSKITKRMLRLWANIVASVPKSVLLLRGKLFGFKEGRQKFLDNIRDIPLSAERIRFTGFSANYLEEYTRDIDIMLDTSPYQGMTTTCEGLYMGIPVVTLVGSKFRERVGYSILKNIGLEELAAFSEEEYVQKAVGLAQNTDVLEALHKNLRSIMQKSNLMDFHGYVKNMESLYERIWKDYKSTLRKKKEL